MIMYRWLVFLVIALQLLCSLIWEVSRHLPLSLSLIIYLSLGEEHEYSRVKVYEPHISTSNFMSLAQLCQDHALLGSHLLSMTNSLASSEHPSEACEKKWPTFVCIFQ